MPMEKNTNWADRSVDLICLGRVAVDLYAEQIHSALKDVQTFRKYIGGCAGNIAVGAARLGLRSVMLSKVGADAMGDFIMDTLKAEGVETKFVQRTGQHLTGLVCLGVCPPKHFPLMFYREQCADMQLTEQDCDLPLWSQTKALLLTGTGFSTPQMAGVSRFAIQKAKQHQVKVILDLDFRPVLWGITDKGDGETRYLQQDKITEQYQPFLTDCDVIVGTEEEFSIATGQQTTNRAIQDIQARTQALIVLKLGEKGCRIYPPEQPAIDCAGESVEVLNVLGAGDAFLSGFLRGWLRDFDLAACAKLANAAGAIVVSRHGCAPAIPYWDELNLYLESSDKKHLLNSTAFNDAHQSRVLLSRQKQEMLLLAFDHRTPFAVKVGTNAVSPDQIKKFKQLIWDGFIDTLSAVQVRSSIKLGVLIDPIYAQSLVQASVPYLANHAIEVGIPIERAGTESLEWLDEKKSLYQQILQRPVRSFVKVLCHFSTSMTEPEIHHLKLQLQSLHQICSVLNRAWMLEMLSDEIESGMAWVYENSIKPTWWKIKAPETQKRWGMIASTLHEFDTSCRIVILGGSKNDTDAVRESIRSAAEQEKCTGFVIGRSVFWDCWESYATGKIDDRDIVNEIACKYQSFIHAWIQSRNIG